MKKETTRFLVSQDIHQAKGKWQAFTQACITFKPDIAMIAGDLVPKTLGIPDQMDFFPPFLREEAKIIKQEVGCELILILGNDDNQHLVDFMKQGHKDKLWRYVSDNVARIDDREFVGVPWVPDHPFGYKYWCRAETPTNNGIKDGQFHKPMTLNSNNEWKEIKNYESFLARRKSIEEHMEGLAKKVKNMESSIWLIHGPPSDCGLDHCASGHKPGSTAVRKFIEDHQPLLTVHGHIHESPIYSGTWKKHIGDTLCINAGQTEHSLSYFMFELKGNKIINLEHSKYGTKSKVERTGYYVR